MEKNSPASWKDAFMASPGPDSPRAAVLLWLKGVCMGSADIVPGVSGGTIALITGIYEDLLSAIKSIDVQTAVMALRFDLKGALSRLHLRFLVILFFGIAVAIMSLARIIHHLLHHQPVMIWSLFFGLIAASVLVVAAKVDRWSPVTVIAFAGGGIGAYLLVGLIPVATPETLGFIFFSGFVAICAMILPGISGAFILLLLGKYAFITATLKNPFLADNIVVIAVFCLGCLTGLLSFSRILSIFLSRWHNASLAFLTGLMAGSMQKIWPWREVIETRIISGKLRVIQDRAVWPDPSESGIFLAILLIGIGFALVLSLERLSRKRRAA
jgi:putative membrane protein